MYHSLYIHNKTNAWIFVAPLDIVRIVRHWIHNVIVGVLSRSWCACAYFSRTYFTQIIVDSTEAWSATRGSTSTVIKLVGKRLKHSLTQRVREREKENNNNKAATTTKTNDKKKWNDVFQVENEILQTARIDFPWNLRSINTNVYVWTRLSLASCTVHWVNVSVCVCAYCIVALSWLPFAVITAYLEYNTS